MAREAPHERFWYDEKGDAILLRLFERPCPETTVVGWRERAARETAAAGGVALSFEEDVVDGFAAFRGLFKFPASKAVPGVHPNSTAVYIVGMTAIPIEGCYFQINTEGLEHGTTGLREAAYGILQPRRPVAEIPMETTTMEQHFDRVRATLAMALPSDAPEAEGLAPDHPLSRIRVLQRRMIAATTFSERLKLRADRRAR